MNTLLFKPPHLHTPTPPYSHTPTPPHPHTTLPFFLFLLLSLALPVIAHTYSTSYSYLTIEQDKVFYRLKVPATQFLTAIQVEPDKLNENLDKAAAYLREKIKILNRRSACNLTLQHLHPLEEDPIFIQIDMVFTCKKPIDNFTMSCKILEDVPELYHQNLAKMTFRGETRQFLFTPDKYYNWEEGGMLGEIPQENRFTRIKEKIGSGIQSILTGGNILLFLLILFLPVGVLKEAFKTLLAFTLSYTLAFFLENLLFLHLTPKFINSLLYFGVAYMALENLSIKPALHRWIPAGIFGSVYGFYSAQAFAALDRSSSDRFVSLFAFYIGTETGQIIILLFLVPAVSYLNRWKMGYKTIRVLSMGILGIALLQFFRGILL
ncbi:MAG TPA: HupE/UreJ family protein [Candidatus Limnocylindrales bacterium]|nr:HupE/UreJ family protein [Candidatus Limnocylindrales bacterium]